MVHKWGRYNQNKKLHGKFYIYLAHIQKKTERFYEQRMDKNINRYGTFATYPQDANIYPTRLSEAGFHYNGNGDEVICFKCGLRVKGWKRGDVPIQMHKSLSPQCPFLIEIGCISSVESEQPSEDVHSDRRHSRTNSYERNRRQTNETYDQSMAHGTNTGASFIPHDISQIAQTNNHHLSRTIGATAQATSGESVLSEGSRARESVLRNGENAKQITPNQTNTGVLYERINGPLTPHSSKCHNTQSEVKTNDQKKLTLEPLGVSFANPVYPQFAITTVRLSSFKEWPKQMKQKPQDLAKAGFFHEGMADRVRCFFCGGGLRNWEPEDEPWCEHARWYPRCVYLRQSKGDTFIYKVQDGLKPKENKQHGKDPLSHPASLSVIEMGYSPKMTEKAWHLLQDEGQENINAEKLLEKVWQVEETGPPDSASYSGANNLTKEETGNEPNISTQDKESGPEDGSKEEPKHLNKEERVALLEENRQLKDQQTCKICLDEDVAIVFLPCGHLAACATCAPALRKCPICRTYIKGTVRAII